MALGYHIQGIDLEPDVSDDGKEAAYAAILSSAHEYFADGWVTHVMDILPPLHTFKDRTILGSFGYTNLKSKQRYLLRRHVRYLGDERLPVTPSQIARWYIKYKLGNRKLRMNKFQYQEHVRERKTAPLLAIPERGTGVYIDLKGAYWQVLETVGWLPSYRRGKYLAREINVRDFPFQHEKLIRNVLVSAGLPTHSMEWTGETIRQSKMKSPLINTMLWSVAMDFLHNIAFMAKMAGAVYVHTDGYIFRDGTWSAFADTLSGYDIQWGIKHRGEYVVRGASDYDIAGKVSKRLRSVNLHPCDTIIPDSSLWFFEQWYKWRNTSWN